MKRIKFFFIRHYQRFLRFLISLSAVSALVVGMAFSASAQTVYPASISQPQLTGNDCYLEVVTANDWRMVLYVSLTQLPLSNTPDNGITFSARVSNNTLVITPRAYSSSQVYTSMNGFFYDVRWNSVGPLGSSDGTPPSASLWLGNSGAITEIHGYNCDVSGITGVSADFVFSYGMDTTFNNLLTSINSLAQQGVNNLSSISSSLVSIYNQNRSFFGSVNMEQILQAIKDNKSSAEKQEYSGVTTDQKQAQSDLYSAENKINADTAEARTTTINIFKSFSIVGDIAKGMLAVTNLFNVLTGDLVFAPALLNFSLAIGAGAFLLGLSAIVLKVVRSNQ